LYLNRLSVAPKLAEAAKSANTAASRAHGWALGVELFDGVAVCVTGVGGALAEGEGVGVWEAHGAPAVGNRHTAPSARSPTYR
jgi:hypothetical protein